VNTFKQSYCATCGCAEADFERRLFWHCLRRRAQVLAILAPWVRPDFFAVDHELCQVAGQLRSAGQLESEIRDYVTDHRNLGWWRRRAKFRLSTRRLRHLAREHLSVGSEQPLLPSQP
jgi:hypothetical protein